MASKNDFPNSNHAQSVQTNGANGALYATFPAESCLFARIHNDTGVALEYQVAGGAAIPIPIDGMRNVYGVTNLSQIGVRRKDTTTTQVTVKAEAIS